MTIPVCLSGGIATNDFMFKLVENKLPSAFSEKFLDINKNTANVVSFKLCRPRVTPEVAAALLVLDEVNNSIEDINSIRLL